MADLAAHDYHGTVKSGRFEVHGLDPEAEVPVYFLDPKHQAGRDGHFSGKSAAGGPVTVRLQPCGTAKARLVDASGKPIAGYRSSSLITMVVTPGPYPMTATTARRPRLLADKDRLWPESTRSTTRRPRVRRPGTDRVPRPGPGSDLSPIYYIDYQADGRSPQGIHRQARRDTRPGRYPDRETST